MRRLPEAAGIRLMCARLEAHRFPPHLHETFVIGVNERGGESFRCGGRRWRAGPGVLQTLAPGEVHSGETWDPSPQLYRAVYLPPAALSELALGESGPRRFRRPLLEDEELSRAFVAAHRSLMRHPGDRQALERLAEALRGIFRRHSDPADERPPAPLRAEVDATRDRLRRRFAEPLRLADLAQRVDLHPRHLQRLFAAEVGLPLRRFLLQERIDRAGELLERGRPPAEVAVEVGFCHQSHLTQHFRQLVGLTPGVYARTVSAETSTPRRSSRS